MSLELGVAIAAVAVSAIALVATFGAWRMVRSLRRDQQAILGGSTADVVDFAVSLQGRIDDLHRAVDEVAAGLTRVDRRVDGAVTNTSVVRYDAYRDAGGQQSASFAFLDSTRSGTVVTAIQGRDYARVYVKELSGGARASPSPPRRPRPWNAQWPARRGGNPVSPTSPLLLGGAEVSLR